MKSVLFLISTISISFSASVSQAQTSTPDVGSLDQFNRAPIRQPEVFIFPNSGSQQFFQQGKDNLYFLESTEPILQIEGEIETKSEAEEAEVQEQEETVENKTSETAE